MTSDAEDRSADTDRVDRPDLPPVWSPSGAAPAAGSASLGEGGSEDAESVSAGEGHAWGEPRFDTVHPPLPEPGETVPASPGETVPASSGEVVPASSGERFQPLDEEQRQTRGLFDLDDALPPPPQPAPPVAVPAQSRSRSSKRRGRQATGRTPTPPAPVPGADGANVRSARWVDVEEPPLSSGRLALLRILTTVAVVVIGAGLGYLVRGTSGLRGVDRSDVLSRNWPVYAYSALLGVLVTGALLFLWLAARSKPGTPGRTRRLAYGAALAALAVVGLAVRSPVEDALVSNDDSSVDLTGSQNPALKGTAVPKGQRWVGVYEILDKTEYSPTEAEAFVRQQRDAGISYASLIDGSKDDALPDDPGGTLDTNQYLVVFGWADTRQGVESWCPLLDVPHEICQARHVQVR